MGTGNKAVLLEQARRKHPMSFSKQVMCTCAYPIDGDIIQDQFSKKIFVKGFKVDASNYINAQYKLKITWYKFS